MNISEVCYNKFGEHLVQVRAVHHLCTVIARDRTCVSNVRSGGTNAVLNWKDLQITLVAPCSVCIKLNCLDAVTFLYLGLPDEIEKSTKQAPCALFLMQRICFYIIHSVYNKHIFNNQLNHPYVYCKYLY
jgi:hypothetical protein